VRSDLMVGITAVLWAVITAMAWVGLWYYGIFVSFVMMLAYLMVGGAKNGKLGSRFLIYPILSWFVVWMICFALAGYFAARFNEIAPTFTILGFHPSFSWIFIAWVMSVATLALGFFVNRDYWLTEDEWNAFKARVNREKGEQS